MSPTDEFERIYREYFRDVYNFLYRLCGNDPHLAEELTQDTFLKAYGSLHRYNGKCSVYTWLCAIGKNCWLHYLRKHRSAIDLDSLADTLLSDEPSPYAHVENEERRNALRRAISALKPRQKDVFLLHAVSELPFSEIARITSITESSAKVLYFRARKKLRDLLGEKDHLSDGR